MSDNEIKEQIDEAARNHIIDGDLSGLNPFYAAVKLSALQDKIATNRTVDEAIAIVKEYATVYDEAIILKELEKLRRA